MKRTFLLVCLAVSMPLAGFAQAPSLKVSATSPHGVTLTCSPAAGTSPTGYNFFKGTAAGGESSTPVNASPVPTCGLTDTAVNVTATYFYTATEIVGGVSSSPSAEVSGQIPVFPPVTPSLIVNGTTGTASWGPSPDGSSSYYIYVGTSPGGESSTPSNSNPVDGGCTSTANCTYPLTGLTAGNTYYITVKAIISGVLSVATAEVSGNVAVPPPTNLKMSVN